MIYFATVGASGYILINTNLFNISAALSGGNSHPVGLGGRRGEEGEGVAML